MKSIAQKPAGARLCCGRPTNYYFKPSAGTAKPYYDGYMTWEKGGSSLEIRTQGQLPDGRPAMDLLKFRPMQLAIVLKALMGADEMQRVMIEAIGVAKKQG